MGCQDTGYLASDLIFKMWFYQDGITRIMIGEPENTRFQISQQDLPVAWSQLTPGYNHTALNEDELEVFSQPDKDGAENFTYSIQFNPLQIQQKSNKILTQVINPTASLYVEDSTSVGAKSSGKSSCFDGLRQRTDERTDEDIFEPADEKTQSISLSTWIP